MTSDSQASEVRTAWKSEVVVARPLAAGWIVLCLAPGVASFSALGPLGLVSPWSYVWVWSLTGVSALALCFARDWNRAELGLRLWPKADTGYWLRISLWMSALVLVAILVTIALARSGVDPFGLCPPSVPPMSRGRLLQNTILTPVLEETLFRFVLCGALAGRLSLAANVALNGVLFALPHVVIGGIGADSVVGGFLLAWAFLRSGSIAVPIVMHAVGNAALLLLAGSRTVAALTCP